MLAIIKILRNHSSYQLRLTHTCMKTKGEKQWQLNQGVEVNYYMKCEWHNYAIRQQNTEEFWMHDVFSIICLPLEIECFLVTICLRKPCWLLGWLLWWLWTKASEFLAFGFVCCCLVARQPWTPTGLYSAI